MKVFLDRSSAAAMLKPWLVYFQCTTGDMPVTDPRIKIVKDPAIRGYASAGVVIKPWTIYVDGKQLLDRGGRPRRFSSEHAATAAAKRSIA
jgi:hypothetical protein